MDLKSNPQIWTINKEGHFSCKVSPLWWWRGDDIRVMPLYLGTILLQSLWDPASGTSWKTTFPVWLLLLLHRHLLHCWLWGRHAPDLAFPAASGHSHLCCLSGAPAAGKPGTFGAGVVDLSLNALFWFLMSLSQHFLSVISVWRASIPLDGEPEVGRELQPSQGSDWEACGVMCQLTEDWPTDGLSQWILCSSSTTGIEAHLCFTNGKLVLVTVLYLLWTFFYCEHVDTP